MSTESSHNDATAQNSQQQYDPDVEYERMKQELMQKRKLEAIVGRQINRRTLPFLYGIYTLALFDLFTVSYAIYHGGLRDELLLDTGSVPLYTSIALLYVPYCILEIPIKVLLQKFRPHVWISLAVFLFGTTNLIQGSVQSYGGFLATRLVLGVFEMSMFAGTFYLTGLWYTRAEAQYRHDLFFSFLPFASGGYALALVAIDKYMNDLSGYAGWRWAFIIQGSFAVVLGFLVLFLLPSLPEESKWLLEGGKEVVAARRSYDPSRCIRTPQMTLNSIVNVFKSNKAILGCVIYFCLVAHAYIHENISPATTKGSGFYRILAQIPDIPQWIVPLVFGMGIGPFSGFNSWH